MEVSTITTRGRFTIPRKVRDRLGVRAGDRLHFRFDEAGRLFLETERADPLAGFAGLLRHLAKSEPITVEEMSSAIREPSRRRRKTSSS